MVQKVLRKSRKGTRVTYVAGNHDEVLCQFIGMDFVEIRIVNETTNHLLDGRKMSLTHGVFFDEIIQHAKWLAYLGDSLYTLILKLNDAFNRSRYRLWMSCWSLSQYLKPRVKNAVSFITEFEQVLVNEARRRGGVMGWCERLAIPASIYKPWVLKSRCCHRSPLRPCPHPGDC